MKICNKCNINKDISLFYKRKDNKDGYRNDCKDCHNLSTKESSIKYSKKESSIKSKKEYNKTYWDDNSSDLKIKNKIKYYNNRENYLDQKRKYYLKNRKSIIKKAIDIKREKLKNDPIFRTIHNLRSLIRKSIQSRGFKKETKSELILGISTNEFIIYIESKFENWMAWENHGLYNGELNYGWDLDHIIPVSFAKTEEDILKLNHWSNFQPLCSKINRDIKRNIYQKVI